MHGNVQLDEPKSTETFSTTAETRIKVREFVVLQTKTQESVTYPRRCRQRYNSKFVVHVSLRNGRKNELLDENKEKTRHTHEQRRLK